MPSTKIAQMVPLCWTKGLPELQIRNIFFQTLPLGPEIPPYKIKFDFISEYGHIAYQIKAAYNNILANVLLLHLHSKGWFVFFSESIHVA